jgi:glucosamine--fructose-6-phosphate aminotransferase (isomerizing)
MCGIFGIIPNGEDQALALGVLANHARQRGKDSSGLIQHTGDGYRVNRADYDINKLLKRVRPDSSQVVLGHSRLITNSLKDNQPVVRNDVMVIHNGIIVNDDAIWDELDLNRQSGLDSEVIAGILEARLAEGMQLEDVPEQIISVCDGVVATAIALPRLGKLLLFSNNGSLYLGYRGKSVLFASEKFPLNKLACEGIHQIRKEAAIIDIPISDAPIELLEESVREEDLIPQFKYIQSEASLLKYDINDIKRCTKCILPETMPFIYFDTDGVCNYCNNYELRNNPRPKEELFNLVASYRRADGVDCIVPFSGGRDSCYGLHLIVNELGMKPVTYTYDWGMVTDLGRRNISRMCSRLGVENIIVADDISKKRRNIRLNLSAWLKAPHLGMMALLTAGDKHFFRHVETVKRQTGVSLNLWGVNPLEVTHFKTGFLGVEPDFEEKRVYSHGIAKQMRYHALRTKAMTQSLGYFNRSLWDTFSGEYYRSFTEKKDYFHLFDYWRWDEDEINDSLLNEYDWEMAPDTSTTWRIGDGTAALYNYIYYTVAGFTEHDTFRSNQIREGQITRARALELVNDENQPRYQNIRWYLDTLGMDFGEVIDVINKIPKMYEAID